MFAGIGGADLAIEQVMGARSAWQIDLVGAAIRRRHWPDAEQVEGDVRAVDPLSLAPVDVLAAGFPCQDLSCAGPGAGLDGARSGLYREVVRFVDALRPRYVVMENVSALLAYMPRLCAEFGALGYGLTWTTCQALDAGHPHERQRVFVVGERGASTRGMVACPSSPWTGRAWPTPTAKGNDNVAGLSPTSGDGLGTACRPWATATATNPNEGEDPASWAARRDRHLARGLPPISEPLALQARTWELGSRLNPDWVEQLMGYPAGWTLPTGPGLRYDPGAPAVSARYPKGWDRSKHWPGYAWEAPRTIPDGPPVKGRPARIRAIGNAWCPQQGALALRAILEPAQASMW